MPNFYWNKPVHQSQYCISQPSVEPCSLDYAKMQCRVDSDITSEDSLITDMIVAARIVCEQYTKRAFITQTWVHNLDAFPFWRSWSTVGSAIQLIKPLVQSVTSIQYTDQGGNVDTLDPSLYTFDGYSEPGRISRNLLQPWPITAYVPNAVFITAVHGYGDSASDVPSPIIKAIAMHTAWQYRNRGDQDGATEPPAAIWALLDSVGFGGIW